MIVVKHSIGISLQVRETRGKQETSPRPRPTIVIDQSDMYTHVFADFSDNKVIDEENLYKAFVFFLQIIHSTIFLLKNTVGCGHKIQVHGSCFGGVHKVFEPVSNTSSGMYQIVLFAVNIKICTIFNIKRQYLSFQYYLYELIINLLVHHNCFYQLHQFLQYHVLSDSKPLVS